MAGDYDGGGGGAPPTGPSGTRRGCAILTGVAVTAERSRFFDPEHGPGSEVVVQLERVRGDGPEEWFVTRRIAYRDRAHEHDPIIVPRDPATFRTDLTSVPQLFTWLVPRTGTHLPAALLHDALTPPFGEPGRPDWDGPAGIDQPEADRIFRDAMADLGTPPIRRWLVWSAVSLPTARLVDRRRALLGYLSLIAIAVLGWLATVDLFDQGSWLFWMGDRPWNRELLLGGVFALLIPLVLAVVWPPRLWAAGAVCGVALAALLHVTLVVASVTFAYQLAELRLGVWAAPRRGLKIGLTVLAATVVVVTVWWCRRY